MEATTEKVSHTPGPWKHWEREDAFNDLVTDASGACGIAAPIVRIRGQEEFRDEMRANARLIAAAPQLLKALKNFLAYSERSADTSSHCVAIEDAARAAIARAEGK